MSAGSLRFSVASSLVRISSQVLRSYFRYFPSKRSKLWIWNHIARPYVAWRKIPIEAKTRSGLILQGSLSDTIHGAVFFFGVWEPALTQYISDSLRPGDVFIDIGANVGVHTMFAAQCVGPTGNVHAIDASATIFAMLRANLARNGISNVTTHNVAVSDRAGMVEVFLNDAGNLGGTTIVQSTISAATSYQSEMVEARMLSDIVPRADILRARIIKIDVEGAEWPVVQGLAPLLADLRADVGIVVEVNSEVLAEHGVTVPRFLEFFRDHGYSASQLMGHSAALCIGGERTSLSPIEPVFDMADLIFQRTQPS